MTPQHKTCVEKIQKAIIDMIAGMKDMTPEQTSVEVLDAISGALGGVYHEFYRNSSVEQFTKYLTTQITLVVEKIREVEEKPSNVTGEWPKVEKFLSSDEILADLVSVLQEDDKKYIAAMPESDLISMHHTLGRHIRNKYWLWHPENPYTDSSDPNGTKHADYTSQRIIERLYTTLTTKE